MPELPEVETLKKQLKFLKNKKIKSVTVKWPKMVAPLSVKKFIKSLNNKKILKVDRRAKILIFYLDDGNFLLVHLKMTGQLVYQKKTKIVSGGHPQKTELNKLPNKFSHIIINFTDGSVLYFNDMRKFGWMRVVDKAELRLISNKFGIEPLKKDFTYNNFKQVLSRYPNRKLKQTLLDQSLIAGLGNIYVDESCFCARIMPTKVIKNLKEIEIKKLYSCIQKILKLAIEKKGTSFNTYVHTDGNRGNFVPYLKVYGRFGEKCKKCRVKIKKIKLNGRGTHFCDNCQK